MNIINLYDNYNSYFNKDLKAIFEKISKIAHRDGFKIFIIGGLVRDMLVTSSVMLSVSETSRTKKILRLSPQNDAVSTNVDFLDIDITVEGDAIEFAQILKEKCNAKIISIHKNFGTVKIEIDGQNIDLASTRSESYPRAGHLPHVDEIGCTLEKDVLRRDFTVNSLALSLNQNNFAHLIDYVGGFEDLNKKKIKVLHEKSFIDDPTRIIRALKYSTRLGFELDNKTLKLQEDYLKKINYDMGRKRIKQEFVKTFNQNSQAVLNKFVKQKIYKLLTQKEVKTAQYNIENLIKMYNPKHPWLVYFGVLGINNCFDLTKYEKSALEGVGRLKNKAYKTDLEVYKAFSVQKLETLLILAATGEEKIVKHYLDNLQKIKLHLNGNDLIKLGFTPSKKFNEVFDYVLSEKLKTPKMNKSQELELATFYLLN